LKVESYNVESVGEDLVVAGNVDMSC